MKKRFSPKTTKTQEYINKRALIDDKFISKAEERYRKRIAQVADKLSEAGCRVLLMAGPSASGKTTSAKKISLELESRGIETEVISVDDFFKDSSEYPVDEEGNIDFENVQNVDIELFNVKLEELVEKGRATIPKFDFKRGRRSEEIKEIELGESGVAIIEGIHALNPLLSESVNHDSILRVYVGLREEYLLLNDELLTTGIMRIVRRMIRDSKFRAYSAVNTFKLWESIKRGEERWIKVFMKEADMLLNTAFDYEPCVLKPIYYKVCEDSGFDDNLMEIYENFKDFRSLPLGLVPADSMLREFLGGLVL
ncbi:MAG: nucleoside kinase [Ruminococcaceae bacterium]|nr:nucleoside kinase [Oscillospiraceae bacterium]